MSEMVERVIKAMEDAHYRVRHIVPSRTVTKPMAVAALEALREPTDAMTAPYADRNVALAHWDAMLSAALSESKPQEG